MVETIDQGLTEPVDGISLGAYLKILRERKRWLLGPVFAFVAVALVWSLVLATPEYEATASLLRQTTSFDEALFNTQLFDLRDDQRYVQTGSHLIKLDDVAELVKADLDSPRSTRSLLRRISVTPQPDTDIIRIKAVSPDPVEAAAIANSFARQFIAKRQLADRTALSGARTQVDERLAAMSPAERDSERGRVLTQKSEELRVLETMQTGGFEVAQEAGVPLVPSSPRPVWNTMLALVGGTFSGVLLAFVVDRADRRIKREETLEEEFGLPVLATIPRASRSAPLPTRSLDARAGFSDTMPAFVEAFRTLRTNLKYFEFDRQIRTILVTSGLPQEGKTTTTVNLAVSLALSGATVGVIDADLRKPSVHRYFPVSGQVGVSNVLAGVYGLERAMQKVEVEGRPQLRKNPAGADFDEAPGSYLFCLAAGPLPPNPAELLGSQHMRTLIKDAAAFADYVLIDTPPVLVVADALSLVAAVDAVIVCSRLNVSTIDEARKVRTLLRRTGARTVGLVARGSKARSDQKYDRYGYYLPEQVPQAKNAGSGGRGGSDSRAQPLGQSPR